MQSSRDNQIRRTARILEIIQQVSTAPQYWTRRMLADHHEISERMIQKDLELVRIRLGLPLENHGEGYFFTFLPHLPSTIFSFSEAIALLSAARAAQVLPGINSSELAASISRLESIFPEKIRGVLKDSLDHLPRTCEKTHRQAMILLLNRAYYERRQICMIYQTQKESQPKERIVEPYNILPYGRSWFLVAYDHYRQSILQFKIDRILSADLLDTKYQVPLTFSLEEYLGDCWGMMRGASEGVENVLLVFDQIAGRWVSEENWHKSQEIRELADGRFEVRFYVGITPEMINWLLYYGSHVTIVEPLWLKEKVKEEHFNAWQTQQEEVEKHG